MSLPAEFDIHKLESGARKRIVILRHPNDGFDHEHYVIHLLIEEWKRWGFTVRVSDHVEASGAGTVMIPHLDETRTPPQYAKSLARCAMVVNRAVTDISKRRISENLVASPSGYDGPVIVKTDRNSCGQPELERFNKGRVAQAALVFARLLPWTVTGMIGRYKIYDHPSLVPRLVWHNPLLVVEKFLPERQDGMYCLRQCTFLGNREINTIAFSQDPIVKSGNVIRREILPEPSPGVRGLRAALGFDFGKIDYVLQGGEVVLFDANRTPTYSPTSRAGSAKPLILSLAAGIYGFFGEQ